MNSRQITLGDALSQLTLTQSYDGPPGLREMGELAGIPEAKCAKKAALCTLLATLYKSPSFLADCLAQLPEGEQALVRLFVYSNGLIDYNDIQYIVQRYKLKARKSYYYTTRLIDYIALKSHFWFLFPGGSLVPELYDKLSELIGPMPRCFTPVIFDTEGITVSRERRVGDFSALVRYCNQTRVPVTKAGLLTKGAALPFLQQSAIPDLTDALTENPADARTLQKLRVAFPLYLLSLVSGLLRIEEGRAIPGEKAAEILQLSTTDFIKKLYTDWQKSKAIREISYLPGIKESSFHISYPKAREAIVQELRQYPVNEWLSVSAVLDYLRICNRGFLRKEPYNILYTGNSSVTADFADAEEPFFFLQLSVYCALGLLDLTWDLGHVSVPNPNDEEFEIASVPIAFCITQLGAYVWGLTSDYDPPEPEKPEVPGGFLVQPDFSLMLPQSATRLQHELFFERFLTKRSSDRMMSIYQLDLDSILRALNLGITVEAVLEYLEGGADKPLPDNVKRAFFDWIDMSRRIRIRNVTILETDDPALLAEISRYKGMEEFLRDSVGFGMTIAPGSSKKIKAIIEKNKRFCKNEYSV